MRQPDAESGALPRLTLTEQLAVHGLHELFDDAVIRCHGLHLVRFVKQNLVHLTNGRFGEFFAAVDEVDEEIDQVVVSPNVEMILNGLAVRCQALKQECPRLPERERVSFDGVGVIIPVQPELLHDALLIFRLERPKLVDLRFESIDFGKQFIELHTNDLYSFAVT